MSDRELLELAAKAADIKVEWSEWCTARKAEFGLIKHTKHEGFWIGGQQWNPLTDDGDALRLAVKLSKMDGGVALMLNSRFNSAYFAQCYTNENVVSPTEYMTEDPYAATRRAIVRAAAEIGRAMP
jgi:hypothetical protein